jgi:hypothetical protein
MITVRSSLVLAAMMAMLSTAACIQPGEIDESQLGGGGNADAGPGGGNTPDAQPGQNPPPTGGNPDAAPQEPPPQELTFTANIYPQLAQATCTGCHTNGGIASFLVMNDNAGDVYARLMNGRVNVDNPEQSLILVKPLANSGVGHRAKLFSDTNNATYKLFLAWIEAGAVL